MFRIVLQDAQICTFGPVGQKNALLIVITALSIEVDARVFVLVMSYFNRIVLRTAVIGVSSLGNLGHFKKRCLAVCVGTIIATSPAQGQERDCLADLDQLSVSQLEERDAVCPNTGEILYYLGKEELRARDYDAAIDYFVRGLENPGMAKAQLHLALGDVELTRGDYARAAIIYAQVANDYPDWHLAHDYLGFALFATGDFEGAKVHLRRSVSIRETASSYRTLTLAEYNLGDWPAAIDALNRAYSLDEELVADRDFMVAGVRSYTEIGRYDVARDLLALLLGARPEMREDEVYLSAGFYLRDRIIQDGQ